MGNRFQAIGDGRWAMGNRLECLAYSQSPRASSPCPIAYRLLRSGAGFTLVELMVVVSIAGILLTLAEPSFHRSVIKAREAALKQNLFTLRDTIDQYRADQGEYPEALAELKSAGYLRRVPMDPFTKSDGTWQEILDETEGGVWDVHSGSELVALDGTPYNHW